MEREGLRRQNQPILNEFRMRSRELQTHLSLTLALVHERPPLASLAKLALHLLSKRSPVTPTHRLFTCVCVSRSLSVLSVGPTPYPFSLSACAAKAKNTFFLPTTLHLSKLVRSQPLPITMPRKTDCLVPRRYLLAAAPVTGSFMSSGKLQPPNQAPPPLVRKDYCTAPLWSVVN